MEPCLRSQYQREVLELACSSHHSLRVTQVFLRMISRRKLVSRSVLIYSLSGHCSFSYPHLFHVLVSTSESSRLPDTVNFLGLDEHNYIFPEICSVVVISRQLCKNIFCQCHDILETF